MFINGNITYSENDLSHLNKSSINIEIQWIVFKSQKHRDIIVANVYRPPQGNIKLFQKYINECMDTLKNLDRKDLFIVGDINIDINKKAHQKTKDLLQNMNSYGLKQYIHGITRFGKTNSCIDLVFSNSECINNAGILDLNFSDHQAVYITRKKQKPNNEKMKFIGRSYRNYNKDVFQDRLKEYDWINYFDIENPNECWEILYSRIIETLDDMCPENSYNIKCYREKWMNRDIMERIIDKDKGLAKAKKTGNEDDWNIAKFLKNETGKIIERAKMQFFDDEFIASKGDPKRFWRNIYSLIPKNKSKTEIINLKDSDKLDIPQKNTASYINDFFTNIGPNLAKDYNEEWKFYGKESDEVMGEVEINEGVVFDLIRNIDNLKSSGLERISSSCLKDALLALIPPLVYLYKRSLITGIFPDKWKIANVVPIFKNGNKSDVSNYRPISLLPIPGKIFENILHTHISNYLENNNYLNSKQNGFRKCHSTLDGIVNFTSDIFDSINKGEYTIAAFIDLKKAFDTVNHNILLEKLNYAGIKNNILLLLKNYLSGRLQKTICNRTVSNTQRITCGVPQGSILGPLFFILYINDIQEMLEVDTFQLYADDTIIYCSDKSIGLAEKRLQKMMNKFSKWCIQNALTINSKKSKLMIFGTRNKVNSVDRIEIKINQEELQMVPTYKYLGFNLDQTLNYKYHLGTVISNISFKLYLFSKVRRFLNEKSAIIVYKTIILPFYDYCDVIYSLSNTPELKKLDRQHLRGMRICLNNSYNMDDEDLFVNCKISKLENRRKVHTRNYLFNKKEKCDINNINTRLHDGPTFKVIHPNVESVKRSIWSSCAIAKSFPNIPSSSRISATMKLHFMTQVPRVTVSRALPRHSSARSSTEHSRPQYLVSSSSARPHFLHVRAARMDTPDPVSTRKLTPFPSIRPGRYSPFPTMTDSTESPFPERPSIALAGHSLAKWPFWWHK